MDYVVQGGEIYLKADQLITMMMKVGYNMANNSVKYQDLRGAGAAEMLMEVALKLDELRSELFKREIEKSFFIDVDESPSD